MSFYTTRDTDVHPSISVASSWFLLSCCLVDLTVIFLFLSDTNEQAKRDRDSYSGLIHERGIKQAKKRTGRKQAHTSYTTLAGAMLFIPPISTSVPPGGLDSPLLSVRLTSVEDVEGLCFRSRRLKASLNVIRFTSRPSPPPPSPASVSDSEVLPRSFLVKSTRVLKALKSVLASTVVPTHHEIKRVIIARTAPTGSLVHISLLNSSASRPKAVVNAIVLSINDVRPTSHVTIPDLSILTTRAIKNTVDCTGSRGSRTREHCDDGFGDSCPITETSIAISEGIGVRNQTKLLTTSSAASCGLVLCCRNNSRPITTLPIDVMTER